MIKENRICMFCENLDQEFSRMGSEWTGEYGENGFTCKAGHFNEYDCSNLQEMRILFVQAATCNDYLQPLDNGK